MTPFACAIVLVSLLAMGCNKTTSAAQEKPQTSPRPTAGDSGAHHVEPYRNGRVVASERITVSPDSQIISFAPDGSDRKQLTSSGFNNVPSWSRDGKRILFSSKREIWVMNADGGEKRRLTFNTPGGNFTPVESLDGSGQTQLTHGLGDRFPDANVPCWSFDGKLITFWAGHEHEYGDVWVMEPDGKNPRRITHTVVPAKSDDPHWAPYGTMIIFGSGPPGKRAMYSAAPS